MGLKIAYLLMIGAPLTGVIIAFVIPMFFGGFSASQNHFEAGKDWHEQGQFEKAIEEYGKAVELKPDFAQAYVKRGEAWFATGDWVQALRDYDDAIAYEKQMVLKMATREYSSYKAAMAHAHFGRAVIYEAQGYSLKARIEAARAEDLGYEPGLIDAVFR
ncbi:MAG: hypothetical protein BZY88_01795 [SAR202 cluster bacterium Io17-Chloro-G9]|nr:MAG: hypothetical protein BZY88_01795 [SAR202 cluster bacterium Io17-Chloro-G9]